MGFNAAAQAVTNGTVPGEWLFSESNYIHCRESGVVENDATILGTGAALTLTKGELVGLPLLKDGGIWRFATAAEVTTGTGTFGFLISGDAITSLDGDETTDTECAILVRGPAIINKGLIPATDPYGGSIVVADYISVANALQISVVASPATTVEQTNQ